MNDNYVFLEKHRIIKTYLTKEDAYYDFEYICKNRLNIYNEIQYDLFKNKNTSFNNYNICDKLCLLNIRTNNDNDLLETDVYKYGVNGIYKVINNNKNNKDKKDHKDNKDNNYNNSVKVNNDNNSETIFKKRKEPVVIKTREEIDLDIQIKKDKDNFEKELKLMEEKLKQNITIYENDINVYINLSSQIKNKLLKEKNLPLFFINKYYVFKFMEENDNVNNYELYVSLQKIIEYTENNNINKLLEELMDELTDEITNDLCMKFIEYLNTLDIYLKTDKKIHEELNDKSPESIFVKDVNI